ncbi:MAG: biotin--[acetyl-CoA-carboxylase] ligase [Chitinispirillaceae bacterium]|nr:biotin--[acetyl-CoA-carboxylase] ligase [Chitinispirillaceae bacterium]
MLPYAFSGFPFVERFYSYAELNSTNEKAVNFSEIPKTGVFVFQADCQNNGRGRLGKTFFSKTEGGLWVSILKQLPDISTHFIHNRAISLAITSSIKHFVPKAPLSIKWPNDIYWNRKKICGILLESHRTSPSALVIGFGLNVNISRNEFPPELHSIASSVLHEAGKTIPLSTLLRTIMEFYKEYSEAPVENCHSQYLSLLYRKNSPVTIEKTAGIFRTVSIEGFAVIETSNGIVNVNGGTMLFSKDN